MQMKKRYLTLIGICAILIMASCGQSQPDNDSSKEEKNSSVKSEAEITQDLFQNEDFYTLFDNNCYDANGNYSNSTYSIDELTITRRKTDTDAGTDNVYVSITSSNSVSNYIGDFHLFYSLYDVGGWYLEKIELESGTFEILSKISEEDIYSVVLETLADLCADTSDISILEREMTSDQRESVSVEVNFNDGVVAVQGGIVLDFYYDGAGCHLEDKNFNLYYDVMADGTYLGESFPGYDYRDFLVVNHIDGDLILKKVSAKVWPSGKVDGIGLLGRIDGEFDCLSRSYVAQVNVFDVSDANGFTTGDRPCQYYFGADGTIYYSIGGEYANTFSRVADPIKNANELESIFKDSSPDSTPETVAPAGASGTADGDYQYLLEFAALCCSDPSELYNEDGEVDDSYLQSFKEDYDNWAAGTDYHYIVMDNTGHLAIDYDIAEAEGIVGLW